MAFGVFLVIKVFGSMRAYLQNVHIGVRHCSPINNPIFTFPVSCVLTVRTFMNHWLLMGHWLFQSQQEVGEGAAGSPWGTQTHGRSIIHGSLWACSEHWHPTCLNQTGPVSLMPLGRSAAQVNVGVGGWRGLSSGRGAGHDCSGQIRKGRMVRKAAFGPLIAQEHFFLSFCRTEWERERVRYCTKMPFLFCPFVCECEFLWLLCDLLSVS